jgi:mannose-6-phosphate isomerase-like protein (cupin superfamily)
VDKIGLDEAFARFDERWSPRVVARVNDYDVKIAHVEGEFAAHVHADTDEYFHVLAGRLVLRMTGGDVELRPGDVYVVPQGVEHAPLADPGTRILMFEPRGTLNGGDAGTAGVDV